MSITGALSNALSGLTVNARAAELVSSNVANAMTEGYGTRSLVQSSQILGGTGTGVRVAGVHRHADEVLIGDRRLADASVGYQSAQNTFMSSLEQVLGTPDQAGSLSGRIAQFEAALVEAAARPESDARLAAVLQSAENLVSHLNATSANIQSSRQTADREIASQVSDLNAGLQDVENLNIKIQNALVKGVDPSGLMDVRQQRIDEIASIVPLKTLPREHGTVALVTTGGALLLDSKAAELSFTATNIVVPEMTIAGGTLSGLTLNGRPLDPSGERSLIAGGSLAGLFKIRDETAVTAQAQVDAVARDLVERFQDSGLDATRAPGAPGLFTDNGAAFDPLDEVDLATRLSVNAVVDPNQGGDLWKLRDGLGATGPGNVGNASLLNDMSDALSAARTTVSGGFSATSRTVATLAADFLSLVSNERLHVETQLGFASAQQNTLKQMEYSQGVDTDAEMQKLMIIEQAYAANAQVISVADEMMQLILGL